MQSAEELGESIGVQAACAALIVPRSSLYRARTKRPERTIPKISPRAFSQAEKIKVRQELNSERFQDRSPREVYATLMDEGCYLCSWRSMYRVLDENHEVRERRNQLRHPNYVKPELLATAPNQLWSWDITKLLGGLDDRSARICCLSRRINSRDLCTTRDSTRSTHHPC